MHYTGSERGKNKPKSARKMLRLSKIRSKRRNAMNGYYTRETEYTARASRPVASRTDRFLDMMYALLCALAGIMRDRTARKIARYTIVVACAIGFIGLVGGMEQGLISMGGGIFAGLALVFVEILCLK
jgi:hypothetical protein